MNVDKLPITDARLRVAACANRSGEKVFAREVLQGLWDHRRDVQSARSPETVLRGERYWNSAVPKVDDFGELIEHEFVDGRTKQGPWAIMTPKSFRLYGYGEFGPGVAQRYHRLSNGRWLHMEGSK